MPSVSGVVAGLCLIAGVVAGWIVRDWRCDAAYTAALEKASKRQEKMQETVNAISTAYEVDRDQADGVATKTQETIREIYRTAPAVPVDCNPDPRVVGLLEGSIRDANAAATGKSSK